MDKALIVKEKWLNLILDGDESGPKLWEIREVLLQVKGIGEKKVDVITAALEEAMEQKIKTSGKNPIDG